MLFVIMFSEPSFKIIWPMYMVSLSSMYYTQYAKMPPKVERPNLDRLGLGFPWLPPATLFITVLAPANTA